MSQRSQRRREIVGPSLAFWFLTACAVFEVFEPAGPGDVVFSYTGPPELRVGDTTAIAVAVAVDGVALTSPRLRVSIANPAVIKLIGLADSLVALKAGNTDLTIQLEHSIFAGEPPDTTIRLQVKQGGGPGT